jgi:hypothetical protein
MVIFRPFRACYNYMTLTQGAALGYQITPRWGLKRYDLRGKRHMNDELLMADESRVRFAVILSVAVVVGSLDWPPDKVALIANVFGALIAFPIIYFISIPLFRRAVAGINKPWWWAFILTGLAVSLAPAFLLVDRIQPYVERLFR